MTKDKEQKTKNKEQKEKKPTTKTKKKKSASTKAPTDKAKKETVKKSETSLTFDKAKFHSIEEAIKLVKELGKEKFDASVEAHFRLSIDPKKGDQQIRSTVNLPHGTGKTIKVAAFVSELKEESCKKAGADIFGGDELIAKIKKTEKTDFQVAVAEPDMMRKLGPIAKILGTRGLMPSPKNDTVTPTPEKAIEELKKGKTSFKNDDTANLHVIIGKKSFDTTKLIENFSALLEAVMKAKPSSSKGTYIKNIALSSSMGPGVKVELS